MRIVIFDLDSLRPDHLGCYGYGRHTSPTLDALAAEGTIFTHCHASNAPCLPGRAALFSGRFGVKTGAATNDEAAPFRFPYKSLGLDAPLLQDHLAAHGYQTVSFSTFAKRHEAYWYPYGWSQHHDPRPKDSEERADEVNAYVLPWLRRHIAEDKQVIHIQYWDIHAHYRTPETRVHLFDGAPAPDWPDETTIRHDYEQMYGPRTARDLYTGNPEEDRAPVPCMPDHIESRDDFIKMINAYDATIRYTDDHLAQIVDVVREAGVYDETAFVVTADHGECFGEQGVYVDHCLANEAVSRVPMIVRWPGGVKGVKSGALCYALDLGPTLCDLLGVPTPAGWDGRSMADAVRGAEMDGRPYLVCEYGAYTLQRAVRTRDWMLVRTLHPGLYRYEEDLWLYDMKADPNQTRNQAEGRADVVRDHLAMLDNWWYEHAAPNQPDPLASAIERGPFRYYTPAQMIARLRHTGRTHFVGDLLDRLRRYHGDRFEHLR